MLEGGIWGNPDKQEKHAAGYLFAKLYPEVLKVLVSKIKDGMKRKRRP